MKLAAGFTAFALLACAASPSAGPTPPPKPAPALHQGPLSDFVAAAGLRWMVVGRPAELANDKELSGALSPLLPAQRLDEYAKASGVDLRSLPEGLIAGFDFSTLYLAQTEHTTAVAKRLEARLVSGLAVRQPHPSVRVVSGIVGRTPETLVTVDGRMFALAVGDPTPARVVEAFARRKLERSPSALDGSALRTLPRTLESAPVRFYAPGPFPDDWARGAHGIVGVAFAVGIAARPLRGGRIELTLAVSGDFEGTSDGVARLTASWNDLASSSTGRLLGLHRPAVEPVVRDENGVLLLRVGLDLAPMIAGLRAAVIADVWEILNLSKDNRP
jgi:hypothetical protein